jgi:hypothetical protein
MDIKQRTHFTLAFDLRPGDIVTHWSPETGEPTTFEVTEIRPTNTNAFCLFDTTLGPLQVFAGTPFEVFDGFDLEDEA